MFTAHDARNAKRNADARRFAAYDDAAARDAEIAACLAANPRIGVLVRKGERVFYTHDAAGNYREAWAPEALVDVDSEPHPDDDQVEFPRGEFNPAFVY